MQMRPPIRKSIQSFNFGCKVIELKQAESATIFVVAACCGIWRLACNSPKSLQFVETRQLSDVAGDSPFELSMESGFHPP